mgnify:CR=1 FL=1
MKRMNDSSERESLTEKHERNREQRITQIKRWAEYISSTPAEEWGPQLNSLVDSQLESARQTDISPAQYQRIERLSQEYSDDT